MRTTGIVGRKLEKIDALTSPRFVAAMVIAVGHGYAYFYHPDFPEHFPVNQGVSFIFVLSGFDLACVYPELSSLKHVMHLLYSHWEENSESALLVKYEYLILEPHQTFQVVFDFLNVDASDGTINRVLDRAADISLSSQSLHRKRINVQASIGKYKECLEQEQIDMMNKSLYAPLKAFNYLSDL
jgi:hypothetical protein